MEEQNINHLPLRTKLYRPPLPALHVCREALLGQLEQNSHLPLVLVTAPAGYGKSTLVSCWMEHSKRPCAWFSCDEGDNDLRQFLAGFVAAVRTRFDEALLETQSLILATNLPPISVLATTLVNELEQIKQEFRVVLDDMHLVQQQDVLDLLNQLLRYPLHCLQLVLIGRRDPLLSIASLRAKGWLVELRMRNLRFTADESSAYLQQALGSTLEKSMIVSLAEKTEGWITALHLAVLAMQGQADPVPGVLDVKGAIPYVMDYLVSEVLERQPADTRDFLMRTAILGRFCASLCDAVITTDTTPGGKSMNGQAFIDWLQRQNLFLIPLDTENRWFRYHHLFQDLLKVQLQRKTSPEDRAAFYSGASDWCEDQAFIEDAIRYALAAGDVETAADIVERHRDVEFDGNRWYIVDRWMNLLPERIRQERPRLLLTEARVLTDRFRLMDIPPVVERARTLLEASPGSPLDHGELLYFQGFLSFWQGDGHTGRDIIDKALALVPENPAGYLRAQIELYVGLTTHIKGQQEEAVALLDSAIEKNHLRRGVVWERLKFGQAMVHFLNCDLAKANYHSQLLLDEGMRNSQKFIQTWASHLLGAIAFQRHELDKACRYFAQIVENKYAANHRVAIDSMIGNAIISELLGQPDEADQSLQSAHDYTRWTGVEDYIQVVLSAEARIAVLRGDLDAAVMWQRGFRLPLQVTGMMFFIANAWITECRVIVATGTDAELISAAGKLRQMRQEAEAIHYTCQTLEIVALQALVAYRQGRLEDAIECLEHALHLAEPGSWVQPFVELGAPMAALLAQLPEKSTSSGYGKRILATFRGHPPISTQSTPHLIESMTDRERDILELLAQRLQNKEISDQLYVSVNTVKHHLKHINEKLQVSNRRQAVAKAKSLGILQVK